MRRIITCSSVSRELYNEHAEAHGKPKDSSHADTDDKVFSLIEGGMEYATIDQILHDLRHDAKPFMPHCIWMVDGNLSISQARKQTNSNSRYDNNIIQGVKQKGWGKLYAQMKLNHGEGYRRHSQWEWRKRSDTWQLSFFQMFSEHAQLFTFRDLTPTYDPDHMDAIAGIRPLEFS